MGAGVFHMIGRRQTKPTRWPGSVDRRTPDAEPQPVVWEGGERKLTPYPIGVQALMLTRPDPANDLLARSIEHLSRNEPAQAEEAARQALAADPHDLEALKALAYSLHVQAKHRESEQVYRVLANLQPSQPLHWMNVGTALRCDDRIDEALFAFARAAVLGADTADFYYNVALAHIGRDDYEAARSLLQKALTLAPDDAEVRYRYAFCCYETLRTDEALAALEWERWQRRRCLGQRRPLMMKLGEIGRAEPTVRQAALQVMPIRAMLTQFNYGNASRISGRAPCSSSCESNRPPHPGKRPQNDRGAARASQSGESAVALFSTSSRGKHRTCGISNNSPWGDPWMRSDATAKRLRP